MVLSSTKVIDYLVCNTLGFAVVISKGQTHQLPHTTSSPQQRTNDVSLFSTANWKKKVKIPLRARRLGTFRLLMALAPRACHMVFFVSSTAFWNDAYLNWIPFCTRQILLWSNLCILPQMHFTLMKTAKRFSESSCFITKNIQIDNSDGLEGSESSQICFTQNAIGGAAICMRTCLTYIYYFPLLTFYNWNWKLFL